LRVFFSTYYEEAAQSAIKALENLCSCRPRVSRSKVISELYYVELPLDSVASGNNVDAAVEKVSRIVKGAHESIFGVKVYAVVI